MQRIAVGVGSAGLLEPHRGGIEGGDALRAGAVGAVVEYVGDGEIDRVKVGVLMQDEGP